MINIEIYGSDYTRITDATYKLKNTEENDPDWKSSKIKQVLELSPKGNVTVEMFEKILQPLLNSREVKALFPGDKQIYKELNQEIWFQGIVGVVQGNVKVSFEEGFPDEIVRVKLQIGSRFDKEKPYFLAKMLFHAKNTVETNDIPMNEESIYDFLLLYWYVQQLRNVYLKGFFRTYRRFEANNNRPRGSIDIARHIRCNMGLDNGKIAYSYRENTINNETNLLIVGAYEYLKRKYYSLVVDKIDSDWDLHYFIETLKRETGYTHNNFKALLIRNRKIIAHPYYTEYETLRKICIRVLRDEGISFFDGEEKDHTQGMLVSIPDLWEDYVEHELLKLLPPNVSMSAQKRIDVFGRKDQDGKSKFQQETRPDYMFFDRSNENQPFMVLDSKFKTGWADCVFHDASLSKYHLVEDYDKVLRDMVSINGNRAGVIFPVESEWIKEKEQLEECDIIKCISQYNSSTRFYTFPVFVPEAKEDMSFSEWNDAFEEINFKEKNDKNVRCYLQTLIKP